MRLAWFSALVFLVPVQVSAQNACPPLQSPPLDPSKVLFSPAQEMELGEVIRQQVESDFQVSPPSSVAYNTAIAFVPKPPV